LTCQGGRYQCSGGTAVRAESCDCNDNDCDTRVDEDSNCPGGSTCTNCQCAFACGAGEFPCPSGKVCQGGFCVNDKCFGKVCDPSPTGEKNVCLDGNCVLACSQLNCATNEVCDAAQGACVPNNCTTFPDRCTATQNCIAGTCVNDPCTGVTCSGGQFCNGGQCVATCAGVQCPRGEFCQLGSCVATACPDGCPAETYCNDSTGRCDPSNCVPGANCGQGRVCNPKDGQCVTDACLGITCPEAGQICKGGSCYDPNNLPPDGTKQQFVTTGGGGCSSSGTSSTGLLILLVGFVVALRAPRRQRREGGV
jgi:Notch 1